MDKLNPTQRALYLTAGERVIAVRPSLVRALRGNVGDAVFLGQLMYWSTITNDPDGWFYNSQEDIQEQTGIGPHSQKKSRERLLSLGLIEEKRIGLPARLHYRCSTDSIISLLEISGGSFGQVRLQGAELARQQVAEHYKDKKTTEKKADRSASSSSPCASVASAFVGSNGGGKVLLDDCFEDDLIAQHEYPDALLAASRQMENEVRFANDIATHFLRKAVVK